MNRTRRLLRTALLAALAFAALGPARAEAGLTVSLDAIIPVGTDFQWDYRITITADDEIRPGDFFIVFDFAGYVDGSIASVDPAWTGEVELTSPDTPLVPFIPDDPAIENLRFTYDGPIIVGPFQQAGFLAESTLGRQVQGAFTAEVTKGEIVGPPSAGTDVDSRGFTPVPNAVPEPSTWTLAALAGGVGLAIRRRRR